MSYQIGLSNGMMGDNVEIIMSQCKKAGISAIEISPPQDKYFLVDYQRIYESAQKNEITLWSFHLPFMPFEKWDISKKELQDNTVAYMCELIDKASAIGVKNFIVHPSGEPVADAERAERMECAKKSLFTLAEYAKTKGAVIAVEDLPRSCLGRNSEEILQLISAHEDLRVCFDSNHLLAENPADFVKKLGEKIVTVHISDYDFVDERHWLPGEGKVDWQAVLTALKETGYQGVWLYEIGFKCPATILRERDLTCEDFVQNAKELFSGKTPTIYGTPKTSLGF